MEYGLNAIVFGHSKRGKALALDTPLPTPTGWTTIGNVKPGDELFNADGEVTRVVAVGPVWRDRPCRKIAVKGDEFVADAAHVWRATRPRGDHMGGWTLVETDQLRTPGGSYRQLPWNPQLNLPDVPLDVHPYVIGVWLGDGGALSGNIGGVDDRKLEVLKRCQELYAGSEIITAVDGNYELKLPMSQSRLTAMGVRVHNGTFPSGGKRYVKDVPAYLLRAGTEQRRQLLAGLLDTDGTFDKYHGLINFVSTNHVIAQATCELALSLGIRAYVSEAKESWAVTPTGRVRGLDHYDVPLRGIVTRHGLTYRSEWQAAIPDERRRHYERVKVLSMEAVPSVPVRCIQVDDLHGMFLAGKSMIPTHNSFLGDTTPAPRLVLDAEAGSRFTPSRKIVWDPSTEQPPVHDGTWDTAIVSIRQFRDVNAAYAWLNSGKHDFRSVVLDSISEIQQRAVDDIAGTQLMKTQDWGQLLRTVSDVVRKFRDLVTNPIKPLDAVLYIAMAKQRADGVWAPYVQGSLATVLPYYVDLCSYLDVVYAEDGSPIRRLFIENVPGYEIGQRVGGRLGQYLDGPDISKMLETIRTQH